MNAYVLVAVVAAPLALAAILVPVLARVAPAFGLVDYPCERKRHEYAVPLVGGLALTVAASSVLAVVSLWLPVSADMSWWFGFSVFVMLMCGVLDDVFELPNWLKALLQAMAVLPPIVFGGLKVLSLGALFGGQPVALDVLAIPFTVVALIGFINAVNLMDGMDGLAGGIACIALSLLGVDAWFAASPNVLVVALAYGAGALGFLAYNLRTPWRRRATVFLGDAGSLVLGLVVGWCAIKLAGTSAHRFMAPMGVAWVLALPVMDTLTVMTQRLLKGRNPFAPDRLHLHHVLVDLGLTPAHATSLMLALAGAYGLFGLLGSLLRVSEWLMFVLFLVVLCTHAAFVMFAHAYVKGEGSAVPRADAAR